MGLRDFDGQAELGNSLLFALQRGKLAHAYIFSGPQGAGKARLARALAAAVLCPEASSGAGPADSCGTCQACLLISQESHPDVAVFRPEAGKSAYPIKQVREEIRRRAYLRPALGPKRFLIIEQAEALVRTSGSRNEVVDTLLKLLEEPAPNTVIILLAARSEILPETVLSRCQHVRLRSLGVGHVAGVLSAECGVSHPEAVFLAHLAGGDLAVARGLAGGRKKDRADLTALRQHLCAIAGSLGEMSYSDLFAAATTLEGYSRGGALLGGALGVLGTTYRDAAVLATDVGRVSLCLSEDPERSTARELVERHDPALLRVMTLRVLKAREDARRLPARLLMLEVLLLDLKTMMDGGLIPDRLGFGGSEDGPLGVLFDE